MQHSTRILIDSFKDKGFTIGDISYLSGVGIRCLRAFENGITKDVSMKNFDKIVCMFCKINNMGEL